MNFLLPVLTAIAVATFANAETLRLGSFNIGTFGKWKMSQPSTVRILVKIIRRYDLIFIQEIRDISNTVIFNLLHKVNYRLRRRNRYGIALSRRLGRTWYKEQYAYIYRHSRVTSVAKALYPDATLDVFEREPFIMSAELKATRNIKKILLIGVHIRPRDAVSELNKMVDVYDTMRGKFHVKDAIIMGDLNADCSFLTDRAAEDLKLVKDSRFTWLIGKDEDTTATSTRCAYDRFIVAGPNATRAVVRGSAKIFRFDEAYNLSQNETSKVSDHYPVELKLS